MRIAALIFAIAGATYLAWDVALTLKHGVNLGTWLVALFAWAMLYQSYALFRARKGARWTALVSAVVFSLSSVYIAVLVAHPSLPDGLFSIPDSLWPMLVTLLVVAAAFGLAAALLALARPPRADPVVNAERPNVEPRHDSAPPVA